MAENIGMGIAAGSHHGGSDLAHTHAVSPATPGKAEATGTVLHIECRRAETALAQGQTYLKFFAENHTAALPPDKQPGDTPGLAALKRLQVSDRPEIDSGFTQKQGRERSGVESHTPAVEIGMLAVVAVEHLGYNRFIGSVAEIRSAIGRPVGHRLQIWMVFIAPAGAELLGPSSAAF